jgi:hypothetical protein
MSKKLKAVAINQSVMAPTTVSKKQNDTAPKKAPKAPKVKDNAIVRTRTQLVTMINTSKGKPFKAMHIGKDGKEHTVSGIRYKNQDNPLGYIKVFSTQTKELRLINPQTVTRLRYSGVEYKASSKPKMVK